MNKKIYLIPFLLLLGGSFLFGQKAAEQNEKFAKGIDGAAVVITCPGDKKNVEDVMKKELKDAKGKGGSTKGWDKCEECSWPAVSDKTLDYYWKVEKAGDDQSKIFVMTSFGNNNFLSSKDDAQAINNLKKFLEDMVEKIRTYELELAIAAQNKVLEDEMKAQEDLVKDHEKLVKDKEKLEKELEENKQDQENNKKAQEEQKKKIEAEKKTLSELQKKLGQ